MSEIACERAKFDFVRDSPFKSSLRSLFCTGKKETNWDHEANYSKGRKRNCLTCGCHYKIHNYANMYSIHMANCSTQDVASLTVMSTGGFCCCGFEIAHT